MQVYGIDPSTGFLDRSSCLEPVGRLAFNDSASGQSPTALWIDLARLKQINESFGHLCGDMVITKIAERLREKSAGRGEWCRVGGDEFVCLIPNRDADAARPLTLGLLQEIEAVKAMPQLGREPGMTVVAEGVEQKSQLDALREAGDDAIQGYIHARPMPEEALLKWFQQRNV